MLVCGLLKGGEGATAPPLLFVFCVFFCWRCLETERVGTNRGGGANDSVSNADSGVVELLSHVRGCLRMGGSVDEATVPFVVVVRAHGELVWLLEIGCDVCDELYLWVVGALY